VMVFSLVGAVLGLAAIAYLVIALVKPEKF